MDSSGGIDANGNIVAVGHSFISQGISTGSDTIQTLLGVPGSAEAAPYPVTDVTGSQYAIPNWSVLVKSLPVTRGYLKAGYMRRPFTVQIGFGAEQLIDELAYAANMDPVAFRRQNVQTANTLPYVNLLWLNTFNESNVISNQQRWLNLLDTVTQLANWQPKVAASNLSNATIVTGRGIGFGGGGNGGDTVEYAAAVADVEVNKKTGKITVKHMYTALDSGLVIGPDLAPNQAIGQTVMATSRALFEEVAFDKTAVTSLDWVTYPILRFQDVCVPKTRSGPGIGAEQRKC